MAADGVRVQTCVTSPPYFGLRDYGHARQIGLESTPSAYVAELVSVFRLVRDLLKDDGTLWLNIGDSYAGSWGAQSRGDTASEAASRLADSVMLDAGRIEAYPLGRTHTGSLKNTPGLKNKDLIGVPWLVAFGLQADGWYLRSDIIWHKPNPMPESITDRPTKAHEYLFLCAKSERYYYDHKSIMEPLLSGPSDLRKMVDQQLRIGGKHKDLDDSLSKASRSTNIGRRRSVGSKQAALAALDARGHRYASLAKAADDSEYGSITGRNRRTVWTIATVPFSGAHFATFPPDLVKPCILAGSRPADIVLDPFMGSGTTAQVATDLGRQFIGCELNPQYVELHELRRTTIGMPI